MNTTNRLLKRWMLRPVEAIVAAVRWAIGEHGVPEPSRRERRADVVLGLSELAAALRTAYAELALTTPSSASP